MDRHGMETVDVVKVDIETSERYLFAKHTEWLDRVDNASPSSSTIASPPGAASR